MARWFDGVGVAVVAAWLGWAAQAVFSEGEVREAGRVEVSPQEAAQGWRDGVEWQGLYLKDKKVGWLQLKKRKVPEGYKLESQMRLYLTVMGEAKEVQTHTFARLGPDMALREFSVQVEGQGVDTEIRGSVEGLVAQVEIDSGGSVQRERVTLKEPPRLQVSLKPLLMKQGLAPGQRSSLRFFDPTSMSEREVVIEYVGVEDVLVLDEEVKAHRFVQELGGQRLGLWTNALGEVLREELPLGMVGVRESGAEARYGLLTGGGEVGEDVIEAVSVKPTGQPMSAHGGELVLALSGLDFSTLDMDGGRQRWTPAPGGMGGRLALRVEPPRELLGARGWTVARVRAVVEGQAPEPSPGLARALGLATRPEALVQSDHPQIQAKAREIAGAQPLDERPVVDLAMAVSGWVHDNLQKKSVIGVPSALETLSTREGDCNEHATLTVALLRALGAPARLAVGVAYLDERGRFFYHAWVEVWAGQWIALDPTFGQTPADLGHVRFVAGGLREQVEMFRVIGKLKVHVEPPQEPQPTPEARP